MQGRTDRPDYKTAMNVCLNSIPLETGANTRRPGTRHKAPTRGGGKARLIPFHFKVATPYDMEFSDDHIRFFSGPDIVTGLDSQTVSSISTANPAVLTVANVTTWVTDDQILFTFGDDTAAATCPLLARRQFRLVMLTTTTFQLHDAITDETLDGSLIGWTSGLSIAVGRILDLDTTYTEDQWKSLRSVQGENLRAGGQIKSLALLLVSSVAPQVVTLDNEAVSGAFAEFSISPAVFTDGPYLDPVPGSWMTPSALIGVITLNLSFQTYDATKAYAEGDYVTSSSVGYISLQDANVGNTPSATSAFWSVVSASVPVGPNGFQPTDIGRMIRLFSEPALWVTTTDYSIGAIVSYGGSYWSALVAMVGATPAPGASNPNQPGIDLTKWALNTTAARWTWGRVTAFQANGTFSTTGLISQSLAGSTNIGDMTAHGGLQAAFDSITNQISGSCAQANSSNSYVGKNYSGASAQAISSGIIYPSNDLQFFRGAGNGTINLRGSASAPASRSDGTLLGTTGVISDTKNPVTVVSTDPVTTWNYVWFELIGGSGTVQVIVAEALFYGGASAVAGSTVNVQILGDPLLYTSTIRTWRLGAYSDSTSYPTNGVWHEGRFWLGGAIDNRFDSSKSNDPFNMAPTLPDGTVTDDSAITYTLNSADVNPILWMMSDKHGIILGTKKREWLVSASALNSPLTPTSIQAHPHTKVGCANVLPAEAEHTTIIVQKHQRKLIEYFADVYSGKFTAPNLSHTAKHLTKSGFEEIAYQQELFPSIWARMGDGSLIGATYKRDSLITSQGPAFVGWHRHELGSGRDVESLCVGSTVGGTLDSVALVTNDPETGIRHVEAMTDYFEENNELTEAWFLDNAVIPSCGVTATVSGATGIKFHGLWHLNGKTVTVFVGGLDLGEYVVQSGYVFVAYGSDTSALFTQAFLQALTTNETDSDDPVVAIDSGALRVPAVVGFTYTSRGQLLRPASKEETGAMNGPPFGKKRRIHQFSALLQQTREISIGTRFDRMQTMKLLTPGGTAVIGKNELFSGVVQDTINDDNGYDGMLCWEVTRPYPATVLALGGFINTQDQ